MNFFSLVKKIEDLKSFTTFFNDKDITLRHLNTNHWLNQIQTERIKSISKTYKSTVSDSAHYDDLRTSPSVSFSKLADFVKVTIIFGLIAFLSPLSTFSDLMFEIVAKPSLTRIWANLLTNEIVSPIPSIWADPCFKITSLVRNNPWFNLVSFLTLKTLVSLNLGP